MPYTPYSTQAHNPPADVITTLARSLMYVDMPKLEITKFYGSELSYQHFIRTCEQSIGIREISSEQKLQFLIQNCGGEAREVIIDCGLYGRQGYDKARQLLYQRYGKPYKIAQAYIEKLVDGPPIKPNDAKALTELALCMTKCQLNLSEIGYNSDINNVANIRKIAARLPYNLRLKWAERAFSISNRENCEPNFDDLTQFVDMRAQMAASVYGEDLLEDRKSEKPQRWQNNSRRPRNAHAASTEVQERKAKKCKACEGDCRFLAYCPKFETLPITKRHDVTQDSRSCFNCLKPGHGVRECRNSSVAQLTDVAGSITRCYMSHDV